MARDWCLPREIADRFKAAIVSGKIRPDKLAEMTSAERHAFLAGIIGEKNAGPANVAFESKLLLKNQEQGIINWAQAMLGGEKTPAGKDVVARVRKLDTLLSPAAEDKFLGELAETKLGMRVSFEEAGKIAELSKNVADAEDKMNHGGDRMDFGRAVVALRNYLGHLKYEAIRPKLQDFKDAPASTAKKVLGEAAGISKAIKASLDDSAIFRQGWRVMFTHPRVWYRNSIKSFADIVHTMGNRPVMDEIEADVLSRPNRQLYYDARLAVGVVEEAFPTRWPEKIPLFGRLYKASENAFTGFQYRNRADIFDLYVDVAKRYDVDLKDLHEVRSIGTLVNALTSRGNLGRLEPIANTVNNVFFSPRSVKSHIDFLTAHAFDGTSGFAKKQAAINLLKVVLGTAAILALAKAFMPESVEKDPRSANFGKIKIGDTRFDVTGGMASLVTLASRLITMSMKSSTTGRIADLHSGKYGQSTGSDVVYNFMENKMSPAASLVRDLLEGKQYGGAPLTVAGEAKNILVPFPISNYMELRDNPNSANTILAMLADALGIATNTYSANRKTGTR